MSIRIGPARALFAGAAIFLLPPGNAAAELKKPRASSWLRNKTQKYCGAFRLEKLELGIGPIPKEVRGREDQRLFVTISNICKECKLDGPDYTVLIVYDRKTGAEIAEDAINGLPRFGDGGVRTYWTSVIATLSKVPALADIRILIDHYCTDIPPSGKQP